ncbi:MAG: FHA domain-containing protein, partial [Thermoflexus sp.]
MGRRQVRASGIALGLAIAAGLWIAMSRFSTAGAQSDILVPRVYGVDTTQFPTVTVFLQVIDFNQGFPISQKLQLAALIEDGQPLADREVQGATLTAQPVGADIVILVDASQSMIHPGSRGYTGRPRLEEARAFVRQIAQSKTGESRMAILAPIENRLEFIGKPDKDGSYLTRNGGELANMFDATDFPPRPKGQEATPLFDLLSRAIDVLGAVPENLGRPRMIIVLSDGIDFLSDQQVVDVTRRAQEKHIVVCAVQIGPAVGKGSERAMDNLRRIAGQTGGQVIVYGRDEERLKAFFDSLKEWGKVWVLRYRSQIRQSGAHQLVLRLKSGNQTLEAQLSYGITIRPPTVKLEWDGDEEINARETVSFPLTIQVEWTDQRGNYGFEIRSVRVGEALVRFEIHNAQIQGNRGEVHGVVDLSGAPAGVYALQVELVDNLGLEARGVGPRIRQPAVASSPASRGALDVLPLASCGIALMALAIAIFAFARSPRLREAAVSVSQPIVQRIKEVTEPFFPTGAARGSEPARAWLIVVEGEPERRRIPIRSTHVRLGRDESLANIVFSERSVSRLHCRIEEVEEGVFMIYDEGSTSGTYVNYEQVPINGQRLQDKDLINLGRVQLQFRLKLDAQEGPAPPTEDRPGRDRVPPPETGDEQT